MCYLRTLAAELLFDAVHSNSSLLKFVILAAETPGCDFAISHSLRYHSIDNILVVVSPTVNDTGEMVCYRDRPTNGRGSSIYIAVGKS